MFEVELIDVLGARQDIDVETSIIDFDCCEPQEDVKVLSRSVCLRNSDIAVFTNTKEVFHIRLK
jgi:hypothetical protein